MPHILLNRAEINGDPRFQTHSAILDVTPYSPKVLIIGTYNEANIQNNTADFFYGRNYFWPVMSNIASNQNQLTQRRDRIGIPPGDPTLNQILHICTQFKLSFADLIFDININLPNHSDKHLNKAVRLGQAQNNVDNISNYINRTPSITNVYATTKFGGLSMLNNLWLSLINQVRENVQFGCILTPSGRRIPNFEGLNITATIARYWIWANHPNKPYPPFKFEMGYTHFNHDWLISSGAHPQLF